MENGTNEQIVQFYRELDARLIYLKQKEQYAFLKDKEADECSSKSCYVKLKITLIFFICQVHLLFHYSNLYFNFFDSSNIFESSISTFYAPIKYGSNPFLLFVSNIFFSANYSFTKTKFQLIKHMFLM
ncbi:unnamed protein product [Rotaria socialis]